MDVKYDKPFLDYTDMIKLMRSRNIIVSDEDFALNALKNISYYTLFNGFKKVFPTNDDGDTFAEPTEFELLYAMHEIDTSLSNLLFKYILSIERSLKSHVSYIVSKNYGVFTDKNDTSNLNSDDYLCRHHYNRSNKKRNNILYDIKDSLNSPRRNSIVRYYESQKNHIPAWITITNIPFGLTIEWYGILAKDDKTYVCEQLVQNTKLNIEDKKEFLKKSLELLRSYRNTIAHGNRLFSSEIGTEIPKRQLLTLSGGLLSKNIYKKGYGKNDVYALVLVLIILLNDRYMINNLMNDLTNMLKPYEQFSLSENKTLIQQFGLPKDVLKRFEIYAMSITESNEEQKSESSSMTNADDIEADLLDTKYNDTNELIAATIENESKSE